MSSSPSRRRSRSRSPSSSSRRTGSSSSSSRRRRSRSRSRSPSRRSSSSSSSRHRRHRSSRSRSRSRSPSASHRSGGERRSRGDQRYWKPRPSFKSGWDVAPDGMNLNDMAGLATQAMGGAARQEKRLHVGNIPEGTTKDDIMKLFNDSMMSTGQLETPPVTSVQMDFGKSFAFLNFNTPEEAQACLQFDGVMFNGNALTVNKPKVQQAPGMHPSGVATMVPNGPEKLFIGGLPTHLSDAQVMELLTAFGPLVAFSLVKDNGTGESRGFGFAQFVDRAAAEAAIANLNGTELGGERKLNLQWSVAAEQSRSGMMHRGAPGMGGMMAHPQPAGAPRMGGPPGMLPPPGAPMMGGAGPPGMMPPPGPGGPMAPFGREAAKPTPVLELLNMVTPEELADDTEYAEIKLDVEEECQQFGSVSEVYVPRPVEGQEVRGVGRVYVRFSDEDGAKKAQAALAGRKFGGRLVLTSFVEVEAFEKREF